MHKLVARLHALSMSHAGLKCKLDRALSFVFLTDDDRTPEERFELISQLGEISHPCMFRNKQCKT